MRTTFLVALALLVVVTAAAGQNLVINGNFSTSTLNWTNVKFNDPLGKHGVMPMPVLPNVTSDALFGDFQTLTPVMECRYDSDPFQAEAQTYPFSFDCMWAKKVTTPIPQPGVNYVALIFRYQSNNTIFHTTRIPVPNQTTLNERVSYSGSMKFPAKDTYVVQVFMRHSNLAAMPFIACVDNIVVGTANGILIGSGTPTPGGTVTLDLKSSGDQGLPYALAASLGPGPTPLGKRKLPITIDELVKVTTQDLLPGIFVKFQGILDAKGEAKAQIKIPNMKALSGVRLYIAYVVIDPKSPFGIKTISQQYIVSIR